LCVLLACARWRCDIYIHGFGLFRRSPFGRHIIVFTPAHKKLHYRTLTYLEARAVRIPGTKALRMLRADAGRRSVWAAEHNRNVQLHKVVNVSEAHAQACHALESKTHTHTHTRRRPPPRRRLVSFHTAETKEQVSREAKTGNIIAEGRSRSKQLEPRPADAWHARTNTHPRARTHHSSRHVVRLCGRVDYLMRAGTACISGRVKRVSTCEHAIIEKNNLRVYQVGALLSGSPTRQPKPKHAETQNRSLSEETSTPCMHEHTHIRKYIHVSISYMHISYTYTDADVCCTYIYI